MRRIVAATVLALTMAAMAWWTMQDFRRFVVEDRGIEFYQQRPYLIPVCIAAAAVIGLLLHVALSRKEQKR